MCQCNAKSQQYLQLSMKSILSISNKNASKSDVHSTKVLTSHWNTADGAGSNECSTVNTEPLITGNCVLTSTSTSLRHISIARAVSSSSGQSLRDTNKCSNSADHDPALSCSSKHSYISFIYSKKC